MDTLDVLLWIAFFLDAILVIMEFNEAKGYQREMEYHNLMRNREEFCRFAKKRKQCMNSFYRLIVVDFLILLIIAIGRW